MRRRWLLIALLVVVNVAANVVVCPLLFRLGSAGGWLWDTTHLILDWGVIPSQGALLAVAAVLPGRLTPWRLAGLVVVLAAWSQTPGADLYRLGSLKEPALLISIVIGVASSLVALRLVGLSLRDCNAEDRSEPAVVDCRKKQFSLRTIMEWSAGVAIILAALSYVYDESIVDVDRRGYILVWAMVHGLPMALIAVVALWTALGRRRLVLRFVALGLATATITTLFCCYDVWMDPGVDGVWQSFRPWCLRVTLYSTWLVASLWLVRMADYRLACRRPRRDKEHVNGCPGQASPACHRFEPSTSRSGGGTTVLVGVAS